MALDDGKVEPGRMEGTARRTGLVRKEQEAFAVVWSAWGRIAGGCHFGFALADLER